MTLDMAQFHESFFAESFEALDAMEGALLKLEVGVADHEGINTIFRGAHSIKGGAGMLGFDDVTSFTHTLETLLDEFRSGRMQISTPTLDILLKSVDIVREMLRAVQGKKPIDAQRVADVQFDLEAIVARKDAPQAVAPAAENPTTVPPATPGTSVTAATAVTPVLPVMQVVVVDESQSGWTIGFAPLPHLLLRGNDPLAIFAALEALGRVDATADLGRIPPLAELDPQKCYLLWQVHLSGECAREQVEEAFDWTTGDCELTIEHGINVAAMPSGTTGASATAAPPPDAQSSPPPTALSATDRPGSTSAGATAQSPTGSAAAATTATGVPAASPPAAATAQAPTGSAPAATAHGAPTAAPPAHGAVAESSKSVNPESSSIRVGIDKIDELINTVGELVITQAMLSELGKAFEGPEGDKLQSGLGQLERTMRQLQESVMRVRMLPISVTFSRFPRLVHDLAQRLGKKIELKMTGEQTELDKTVLEKIGDPLVHLVRNSIDHGIEMPEVRTAAGKPPFGTINLNAFHSGGNIAVEITDDGAGLDKERILAKGRSRGLIGANDVLTDEQIHELIFLPGFSTAEKTTDVSGRGVGMDVVRQRVAELGGSVDIRSTRGQGSRFLITLPLTLAIVDGQSVQVGTESYIVPLTSIIESLQLQAQTVSRLSGAGEVFSFRGEYLPIVRLHDLFGIEPRSRVLQDGLVVVAEGDGRRVGLFVDELLGQQQVVIKSMEPNYGRVEGISGATILGDGLVALILDVPGLIRAASGRAAA
jgi:two-component system chemotaxis sensor kinase CheA